MNDLSQRPDLAAEKVNAADTSQIIDSVAQEALHLGRDIVEIAAALDSLSVATEIQLSLLEESKAAAQTAQNANADVRRDADAVASTLNETFQAVAQSVAKMRETGENARKIAAWVQSVVQRMAEVTDTLSTVQDENSEIRSIAKQINILAINAKIEAVRAGNAGRGFAVVAEAINELSQNTGRAAEGIGSAVTGLTAGIREMRAEAETISTNAANVLTSAGETDQAMSRMTGTVEQMQTAVEAITTHAEQVRQANTRFAPAFERMAHATEETVGQIHSAQRRTNALIASGETIVQHSVSMGGSIDDSTMIDFVQEKAAEIAAVFENAIASGRISETQLFNYHYTPIVNSNPKQVMAPFTRLTDEVLPPIQEKMLSFDPRIAFCAAVDVNGYLPTHNMKFSRPQGSDPAWNAANCRNRRIFDDRVGAKAGKSTAPFVLQIYRRDMGGGTFVLMKDLSAPIRVAGRHWGGLRIGYKF